MPRSIPEQSIDTKMLIDALQAVEPGFEMPYVDLTKCISRDVTGPARSNMQSARRHLEREGIIFGAIRGIGLKRLQEGEKPAVAMAATQHIGRVSRRAVRVLASVSDFDALTPLQKTQHNSQMALHGVIAHATRPRQVAKLEKRVDEAAKAISLTQALEALK